MRPHPVADGWVGSLFDEPIAPRKDDNWCHLRGGDCLVQNGCQNGLVPCTLKDVNHLKEIQLPCERDTAPKLESPWVCDCRNCGEYRDGHCPIYGCMCATFCRLDPPCTIERCVGYWPASDEFDKLAEDRVIMYLQSVSEPTIEEMEQYFSRNLLDQLDHKGLIKGWNYKYPEAEITHGHVYAYRYDLGDSSEELVWRVNHTPRTLAAVAKQMAGGVTPTEYEPFAKWQLLMRNRKKAEHIATAGAECPSSGERCAAVDVCLLNCRECAGNDVPAKPAPVKPWKPEGMLKEWQERNCGKHHTCRDDCTGWRSGSLCPFAIELWYLKTLVREGDLPADLLDDRAKDDAEAKAAEKAANPAKAKKPKPAPAPKLQDCTDCICPHCANNGASCTDCKGPEQCAKHNGKIGLCPDFRVKDGEQGQNCMKNGCLCFTCERIGEECEDCQGPIDCKGPTTTCEDYISADTEEDEAEASDVE